MNAVFADTSYYVALLNPADEFHAFALKHGGGSHERVVVTEFVLIELANSLSRVGKRESVVAMLQALRTATTITVVAASHELFERGLALFQSRPDKDWSLTDCISFVVMEQHGLTDALTADRHFEQAGFKALLR